MIPMPSNPRRFRRVTALLLFGAAGLALYLGRHVFFVRSFGLLAMLAAMGLGRSSHGALSIAEQRSRPPPLTIVHWVIATALVVALLVMGHIVSVALQGDGTEVWPAYAFAGVALVTFFYLSLFLTRLGEGGTRWPWTRTD